MFRVRRHFALISLRCGSQEWFAWKRRPRNLTESDIWIGELLILRGEEGNLGFIFLNMTTFDLPDELRKPYWENQVWMAFMVACSILWARCWFLVEMGMLRSSAHKIAN